MTARLSATSLIEKDGKVLSVSRKDDHTAKGLPGGKPERGETLYEAMVRETFEETGIRVLEADICFHAIDDIGFDVTSYRVTKYEGEPTSREAGLVEWLTPEEMSAPGPFQKFNTALFTCLGMM